MQNRREISAQSNLMMMTDHHALDDADRPWRGAVVAQLVLFQEMTILLYSSQNPRAQRSRSLPCRQLRLGRSDRLDGLDERDEPAVLELTSPA